MPLQTLFIAGPAGALEIHYRATTGKSALLICHPHPLYGGSMNNKVVTTLCQSFSALDYATVCFNFRGVGQSEGTHDEGIGEQQDTLAVIAWLKQQGIEHIVLAGFSFGAAVALGVSHSSTPIHLLLIAPPVFYPIFQQYSPAVEWSIITAAADEVVSTPDILTWVQKQTMAPRWQLSVPDASHFFHGKLHILKAFVLDHYPKGT
jgi:alpha/beta superfamily hydrolase